METTEIKSYFKSLSIEEQKNLLIELSEIKANSDYNLLEINRIKLDEKQGVCPHCGNHKYIRHGKDSGVQRYKCKSCQRTFTPFTGTWLAQIHKKEKLVPYLKLMQKGLSLEKIRKELKINKKTAFDWRHKINYSLENLDNQDFIGITESDETFFLHSETGSGKIIRKSRKRGKQVKKSGISDEQVAVIVTTDRKGAISLNVAGFGRITKDKIESSIGNKINKQTILCSDGHASYKGFASDNSLEHHILRANLKEFVKEGKYHIQNVNSMHSRLKTWINRDFYGVATKYLQNYLNWFRLKEKYRDIDYMKRAMEFSLSNLTARAGYLTFIKKIKVNYQTTTF